jgi:acetyl esterase/lipase
MRVNEEVRSELDAVLEEIAADPWPDDTAEARALYDRLGPAIESDIAHEYISCAGVAAQVLTPPGSEARRAVVFLHGGGYVFGSLLSHGGMAAEVGRAAGCRVLQVDYRLAPEHPHPAAIEDACASYEWLLEHGASPETVAFVGDSAGGGLVLAALLTLRDRRRPLPAAAALLSPWVDLEATGESYRTRQSLDPMIDIQLVLKLRGLYIGERDPRTPTVSPIHADLGGMPPLLIQVGEREVLFSEAQLLAANAEAAGVEVEFEEWCGMVHVWHLYYPKLSAGRKAIDRIGQFIRRKTRVRP